MGYFPVRYDSRVVIYDRRGFIRLATVEGIEISNMSFHEFTYFCSVLLTAFWPNYGALKG